MQTLPEWAAWLRLTVSPGLTAAAARRLLAAFGSANAVLEAPPGVLREVAGVAAAAALARPPDGFSRLQDATAQWLDAAPADAPRHLVPLGDPHYPEALLQTPDPPLLLHAVGRIALLHAASVVAIVGSRQATAQGLDHARSFGRLLSERGTTVVSGLALGIDGAAHEGAVDGPGGTIAVVGTGLDQVYPKRHVPLARRIERAGLIVSELALGAPPLHAHFPQRNRIIAGLARGTLVVEAALQSGSLITARLAAEAGRDVFAIPGSILSLQSRGCHRLIQQGAKLVETVDDILQELPAPPPPPPGTAESDPIEPGGRGDSALLSAMGHDPVTLDALATRTGLDTAALGARLLVLELAGQVARLPGSLLQRRGSA